MRKSQWFGRFRQGAALVSLILMQAGSTMPSSGADVLFVSSYVANAGNLSLFDYDGTSLTARQTITSNVNGPTGLAFDGTGDLFVANVGSTSAPFTSKVARYTADSNGVYSYSSQFSSTANMIGPRGLVIGSAGHFYAANTNQNTMNIFDSGGTFQANVTGVSTNPRGLAFDTGGLLYVANFNNQIRIYDVTTPTVPSQVGLITNTGGIAFNGPQGIAFDSTGRMLISNYTDDSISILKKVGPDWVDDGKFTAGTNLNGPYGLTFDSGGNLVVANFDGNSITKFAPSGSSFTFVSTLATGITAPTFIQFRTVVPEPSTMVLSTIAIGAFALSRWFARPKTRRQESSPLP